MRRAIAFVPLVMFLAGACASGPAASGSATVTVTEEEWTIKLSQASVPAGQVKFVVKNVGKVEHELAILRTDVPQDKLPARAADPKKVEEAGSVGEVEGVATGTTKEATLDLKPGSYVLICNVADHYASGMHVAFVVK